MDASDPLVVLVTHAEFEDRLTRALSECGIRIGSASSWTDARAALERDDSTAKLAIVDVERSTDLEPVASGDQLLEGQVSWPVFLSCKTPPTPEASGRAYRSGILGYLHEQAPLQETLFRVQACLELREPRSYLSPPRATALIPVQLTVEGDDQMPPQGGLVGNLSRTGMMLRVITPPSLGSRVTVSFWLPQRPEPLRCSGRVAWSDAESGGSASGIGVEFEEMDATSQALILDYVLHILRPEASDLR